jgi:hypothetical protein
VLVHSRLFSPGRLDMVDDTRRSNAGTRPSSHILRTEGHTITPAITNQAVQELGLRQPPGP